MPCVVLQGPRQSGKTTLARPGRDPACPRALLVAPRAHRPIPPSWTVHPNRLAELPGLGACVAELGGPGAAAASDAFRLDGDPGRDATRERRRGSGDRTLPEDRRGRSLGVDVAARPRGNVPRARRALAPLGRRPGRVPPVPAAVRRALGSAVEPAVAGSRRRRVRSDGQSMAIRARGRFRRPCAPTLSRQPGQAPGQDAQTLLLGHGSCLLAARHSTRRRSREPSLARRPVRDLRGLGISQGLAARRRGTRLPFLAGRTRRGSRRAPARSGSNASGRDQSRQDRTKRVAACARIVDGTGRRASG